MEVKVTVNRRYVEGGPIEMFIRDEHSNTRLRAILDDYYGQNRLHLSMIAKEIEYAAPLLEVFKNEYEKIIQERKDK